LMCAYWTISTMIFCDIEPITTASDGEHISVQISRF
jgi:hypothetical protein